MTKVITFVEIDINYCSLNYGVSPCTAAIGVTGSDKCYNTRVTCQDIENIDLSTVTLRFTEDLGFIPDDIEAIPNLIGVEYKPGRVSLGEDLGERSGLTVKFRDSPHGDAGDGFDKYHDERSYNPFEQGTLWGKFRARQPYLRGNAIRLIRGYVGQNIADMNTRHFLIDSFNFGPGGIFTVVAKDVLKLADSDRAKAPVLSSGSLSSALTAGVTSATLVPTGIGDIEYPSSGHVAIGGEEICSFTRSGDDLTLVRGLFNTDDVDHEAEERVQLCLYYQSEDPADIIYDLLSTYAGVDTDYLPLTNWLTETSNFYGRLLTAMLPEPTSVNKLVSEIIQTAALAMWWDDENQQIRLQVLRAISADATTFTQENTLENTLQTTEQPNTRISQVWTYYGRRNPLLPLDEKDNYKSGVVTINSDSDTFYGSSQIKVVLSRWIPTFAKTTAERLNSLLLARFADPPRMFQFEIFRWGSDNLSVELGQGYNISGWSTQDASGAVVTAPIQVTRLNPGKKSYIVEAEEILITETEASEDLSNRTIIIDSNTNNVNMRTLHDNIYPDPEDNESPSVFVTCVVSSGIIVGSDDTSTPAFDVGTWPAGVTLLLQVYGRIQGAGGKGGGVGDLNGEDGGVALYTREVIDVDLDGSNGEIWGGGGGGGAWRPEEYILGGGGGAGTVAGAGGLSQEEVSNGQDGTATTGGAGGDLEGVFPEWGGAGGDPGQDGEDGANVSGGSFPGGDGGAAIDGDSYVTLTNGSGDILGDQIN